MQEENKRLRTEVIPLFVEKQRIAQKAFGDEKQENIPSSLPNYFSDGSNEDIDSDNNDRTAEEDTTADQESNQFCYTDPDTEKENDVNDFVSDGQNEITFSCTNFKINKLLPLREQLAKWCVHFRVPGIALSVLLTILIVYDVAPNLPKDCRTLLQTAKSVRTKIVRGGEYFHFGLAHGIRQVLEGLPQAVFDKCDNVLELLFNIDGLPVFKSTNTHLWPILCAFNVDNRLCRPFTVGIFYGVEKLKKLDEYLEDFVRDLRDCKANGLMCRNRRFEVQEKCFICDAPARAFVKNIKGHNAKEPCERCKVRTIKIKGRAFPVTKGDRRKNCDYETHSRKDRHKKGLSPLIQANVKLKSAFVLDYMHLVLLGVMRKLLFMWFMAEQSVTQYARKWCRLSDKIRDVVDARLLMYAESCPDEFARKPRSTRDLMRWKATEYRTFLLYTALLAMKGKVHNQIYANLTLLVVAMRIYLSKTWCAQRDYRKFANKCISSFVKQYSGIYGKREVVYNVHNLLHLGQDAKRFGSLDSVSGFPFENHLYSFKRMIRNGSHTIQQVVRRIDEDQRFGIQPNYEEQKDLKHLHVYQSALPPSLQAYEEEIKKQCKAVVHNGVRFSVWARNSCIRLKDQSVGKITNIFILKDNSCILAYREYKYRRPFFMYPCSSEFVGISCVNTLSSYVLTVDIDKCSKAWLLPLPDQPQQVAIDLL